MRIQPKRSKRLRVLFSFRLFSVSLFLALWFSGPVFSQNHLSRISLVDRSDGQGSVIRYHLEEAADSFKVSQPAADLVQMTLYAADLDTSGIILPQDNGTLKEIYLYDLGYGFGIDLFLQENTSLKAAAYLDRNHTDILLGLTRTDEEELRKFTENFTAHDWADEITPEDALEITPLPSGNYLLIKEKLRFDKVVIDPGHGGHDPGNIGYGQAKEKDVVLQIAKKLGGYIEEYLPDVEVIYTRETDVYVGLEERGRIANRSEADLFVSIHADAWTDRSVRGSSVFFLGLHRSDKSFEVMKRENQVYGSDVVEDLTEEDLLVYELANSGNIAISEKIAYMVEDQLKNRAARKSRGVKQMGLVVLYQSTMPGILVETGFLTNPAEKRYLTSDYGQSIIASAIFRAIRDYKVNYEKGLLLETTTSSALNRE